ncbi:uncharacterized protein LOC124886587 [Capsicum annuum]|uniref:uncharacterized protein LOC124886587 n=1 Tax=Capsicum annuum TaxID=4072 RepID=UPI001FB174D1|nr:uncharacterized protein LOC124886587 [Capsicum annuum]
MRNHESRLAGTAPFLEVNAVNFRPTKRERSPNPSRGCGRGCGSTSNAKKKKGEAPKAAPRMNSESKCYRCGGKRHWSRTYRTPKHLVKLYQMSLKRAENNVEANFLFEDNVEPMDLEVSDFFVVPEEHVNHRVVIIMK